MTVCLKIENQLVDVIVILYLNEIQIYPVHVLKISASLASNQCICAVKKTFVWCIHVKWCTFTVDLHMGNSINLMLIFFSYDNWIFATTVKFDATVLLHKEWFSTARKVFQNLAHACYPGLTVVICCVYVTDVVFFVFWAPICSITSLRALFPMQKIRENPIRYCQHVHKKLNC